MSLEPGARLGPYQIGLLLGAGGMGEVYRAHDTKLNRSVALKVLPAIFAQDADRMVRFEREAQVLASLNHPNIASIYGLEESGPERALVMELVEGPTLAERIAQGPIPQEEALPIARQIAEALETAHEQGIVHRDLKPANVKLRPDGTVKVLDFGLAKAIELDAAEARISGGGLTQSPTLTALGTQAGVILGTAAYMSPEQARGKGVDKRTDIWAFGCVLYEMLTGRPVFTGETVTDVLAAVVKTEPEWTALPASIPAAIRRLLRHLLEKELRARLRDIGDVRICLNATPDSPAETLPSAGSQTAYRGKWAWAVAGLLLTALIGTLPFTIAYLRQVPAEGRVLKFSVPPPEKASFSSIAVSPDGRWLAFTAATGGKDELWVRALDTLTAQALPGTEGARFPFWSPDSRFLGFAAGGKLKKIGISGGPVQTLCDAGTVTGATWSRDGVIIFTTTTTGAGLSRVPATGGAVIPVAMDDKIRRDSLCHTPFFLPDGRHFLFYERLGGKEIRGIYVGSLDQPMVQRLLGVESNAAYAPSLHTEAREGHLFFVREGALLAQPFDVRKLQVTGEPYPVAERVGCDPNYPAYSFAVSDNGVLVYDPIPNRLRKQLVWVDRGGRQIRSVGMVGSTDAPSISPDEKRIVATQRSAETERYDLWLHDAAGGGGSRFTFGEEWNRYPVWSPDGNRIAWASVRSGTGYYDIYWKTLQGAGEEEPLLKSDFTKIPTDWSLDGRFLIYYAVDPKRKRDVWALPLSGDRKPFPFLQTEANETGAQLSPDGRWMAYASDESGGFEIYVQSFPSGGGKKLISTKGGYGPRWRKDGKELYYYAPDGKLMAAEVKAGASFEAEVPLPLFEFRSGNSLVYASPYAVTADGKRFLLNTLVDESGGAPLTVVVNWTAGLKK